MIFEKLRSVGFVRDPILVKSILEGFDLLPESIRSQFVQHLIDVNRVTGKLLGAIVSKYLQDRVDAGFEAKIIGPESCEICHYDTHTKHREEPAVIDFFEKSTDQFGVSTFGGCVSYPLNHLWVDNWAGELVGLKAEKDRLYHYPCGCCPELKEACSNCPRYSRKNEPTRE